MIKIKMWNVDTMCGEWTAYSPEDAVEALPLAEYADEWGWALGHTDLNAFHKALERAGETALTDVAFVRYFLSLVGNDTTIYIDLT